MVIAQFELADVDPEPERVRGGDAEQLACHESPLDLAPLRRRIAGPVGASRAAVAVSMRRSEAKAWISLAASRLREAIVVDPEISPAMRKELP